MQPDVDVWILLQWTKLILYVNQVNVYPCCLLMLPFLCLKDTQCPQGSYLSINNEYYASYPSLRRNIILRPLGTKLIYTDLQSDLMLHRIMVKGCGGTCETSQKPLSDINPLLYVYFLIMDNNNRIRRNRKSCFTKIVSSNLPTNFFHLSCLV